jgi:hypothetical protein
MSDLWLAGLGSFWRQPVKSNVSIIKILKRARSYLEKGWCRGSWARKADGSAEYIFSRKACSWCLEGALLKAENQPTWSSAGIETRELLLGMIPKYKFFGLQKWNDAKKRTKRQVLSLLDRAMARLEKK